MWYRQTYFEKRHQFGSKISKTRVITAEPPYHANVWEYPPREYTCTLFTLNKLYLSFWWLSIYSNFSLFPLSFSIKWLTLNTVVQIYHSRVYNKPSIGVPMIHYDIKFLALARKKVVSLHYPREWMRLVHGIWIRDCWEFDSWHSYCSIYIQKREWNWYIAEFKIISCLSNICKEAKLLQLNIPVEVW